MVQTLKFCLEIFVKVTKYDEEEVVKYFNHITPKCLC